MTTLAVCLQKWADQEHGGAGSPDQVGQDGADPQKSGIDRGFGPQIPGQTNPPGNGKERSQENNKREIFKKRMNQERSVIGQEQN